MSSYKVEIVESSPICVLGEGPHWDIDRQSLYYVDIYNDHDCILRFDYKETRTYSAIVPGHPTIAFIIPVVKTKDQFIVGSGSKILLIKWDGKSGEATPVKTIGDAEPHLKNNRFNDSKCDPSGTFFGGTMVKEDGDFFEIRTGTLYRYTSKEQFVPFKSGIGCSNGLTWNEKTNKFYYIDSAVYDIKEFDYDPKTKNISNERVLINFKTKGSKPEFVGDGMTIDSNGSLYVAAPGSSKVLKINPNTSKIDLEIEFPVKYVTSVAFGGPNLDILYATTVGKNFLSKEQAIPGKPIPMFPSPSGRLFAVTGLGVIGLPMKSVNLE